MKNSIKKIMYVFFATAILVISLGACQAEAQASAVLTEIQLDTENVKKEYFTGESLDLRGLIVTGLYSDGKSTEILDFTTSMEDQTILETAGNFTITVSYKNKTAEFSIKVLAIKLDSIVLDSANVKKSYFEKELLDLTNLTVTAYYNDGTSNVLSDYDSSIQNNSELTAIGKNTVTITYGSKSASFEIEVIAIVVDSIEIATENVKKEYFEKELLDLTNLTVTASYNNGTTAVVNGYDSSIQNNSELTEIGKNVVTITFGNKSASFEIEVIAIVIDSIELDTVNVKKIYYSGESFSTEGLVVTATYNNGAKKTITDYECSVAQDTIFMTKENKTITVTYQNQTAQYSIEILNDKLSVLEVTFPDFSDKENLLTYSNGTFTAAAGYASYVWMLDDEIINETSNTYTPDTSVLKGGKYNVLVLVTASTGMKYSAYATLSVTN